MMPAAELIVMMWPPRLGAHDREDRAGDVQGSKEVRFHLRPELFVADFLEVAGVEVPGVIDEHVNAPETPDGNFHGGN